MVSAGSRTCSMLNIGPNINVQYTRHAWHGWRCLLYALFRSSRICSFSHQTHSPRVAGEAKAGKLVERYPGPVSTVRIAGFEFFTFPGRGRQASGGAVGPRAAAGCPPHTRPRSPVRAGSAGSVTARTKLADLIQNFPWEMRHLRQRVRKGSVPVFGRGRQTEGPAKERLHFFSFLTPLR
jgi:hypothetical protein